MASRSVPAPKLTGDGQASVGKKRSKQLLRVAAYGNLLLIDIVAIAAGFGIGAAVRGMAWLSPQGYNLGFLILPIYLAVAANQSAYSLEALKSASESSRRALSALLVTILFILMLGFFVKMGFLVSRLAFAVAVGTSALFIVFGRVGLHAFIQRRFAGALTDELLVVDGVDAPTDGQRYVVHADKEGLIPDLQNPAMLARISALFGGFDRVVVACAPERQVAWSMVLKGSDSAGELLTGHQNSLGAIGLGSFGDRGTIIVSRGPLSLANRAKKRLLDLAITVPALIFLAPLMVLVAIAIKLESRGPIFFSQPRVGQGNSLFRILKFRSMRVELNDINGSVSTQIGDARITRVGNFIRKTSIDELPQLINVLRSEMSLVGPRPHALGSLAGDKLFWEVSEHYWQRHALKPGITGLAQIRGFRGATHRREDLEQRLIADLEYVHGWRLWRDISILFATLKVLVHPNAY